MNLYKRGKTFYFELEHDGTRYQRSTRSKNERVARQIASAFHTALIKGDVGIVERRKAPALPDAMKAFLAWSKREHATHPATHRRYQVSSKALLEHFKGKALDAITVQDVEAFKADRGADFKTKKGKNKTRVPTKNLLRPATINRELACLRAMYNHAIKAHPDLRNPVSSVKFLAENNQQDRVLTFPEQWAYLEAASETLKDVAGLILETGMRPEEVYTLEGANVSLEGGYLKILKGKTPSAKRRIELTAEAKRILESRMKEGYLFPCERKTKDAERPIPKINNAHDRAIRAARIDGKPIPPFRLYDLRHTWATRAAEAGTDLVTLAAMLGHARIQMVLRYAHPTQGHQSSAMQKLEQHNAAKEARAKMQVSGLKIVDKSA